MERLVRRLRVGEGKVEQGGRGVGGLERRWKGRVEEGKWWRGSFSMHVSKNGKDVGMDRSRDE